MLARVPRPLLILLAVAFLVSIVHYVDNTVNYADFPSAEPGSLLAGYEPSRPLVGAGWFVFTAFGVLGLWLLMRDRVAAAAIAIALYSGSGLVGFGNYAVPGAMDMPWWRHAHVVADIVCGVLLCGYALWMATRGRQAWASVPR